MPLQYYLLEKLVVLVQYVITAKNPFKTSIDTLQVMLSNFKKTCTTRFSSASLTALGAWAQFFVTMMVIAV